MTDKIDTKAIRAMADALEATIGRILLPGDMSREAEAMHALCDALDELRADNERLRNFIVDFSETKFDRIDRRSPDPQDDLDPLTDYLAIEAWQEDAQAALAQKEGK